MTAAPPPTCDDLTGPASWLCERLREQMAPPPPPPPPPSPWWAEGSTWAAVALVLALVLVVLAVRRSPRLQELLRTAVAAAKLQAQPAAVVRWGGPLGRLALALVAGAWRFVRAGHGARSQTWRAVAVLVAAALVIGSPLGAGGFLLGAASSALGVPSWLLVLAVVGLVVAVVMASRDEDPDSGREWWSERRLLAALVAAGVLPKLKDDEPRHVLRRRGQPRTDEFGTVVVFELPGAPWQLVRDRADRLAAALRIDGDRLVVTHPDGQPSSVVRLFVGAARREGSTPAEVGSAQQTSWSTPVRIGTDPQGRPVTLQTDEANSLLAGQPGAGKTSVARIVLGHYLMDSTAAVYLLDGKGSRRDYGAAVPLCARFVSGTDETAVEDTEEMLGEVLQLVRTRNSDSGDDPAPGGVLLLLEELQDVRAAADRATRDRLDSLLGRCVRMGRAVGVTVLISTQRPSTDDLPSGVRNLVSQRLALMLRNAADAALVLGTTPTLPLPSRRGQALLTTATGTVAVELDLLDDAAWTSLCSRAATARSYALTDPAEPERSPFARPLSVDPVEPASEPPVDLLLDEVVEVLRDADPAGITASALHASLPAWVRPDTAARLGMALRPHLTSGPVLQRGHRGKAAVVRLAVPGGSPVAVPGAPPAGPRQVPGPGTPGTSSPPEHAQVGASVAQSPESPAGAR